MEVLRRSRLSVFDSSLPSAPAHTSRRTVHCAFCGRKSHSALTHTCQRCRMIGKATATCGTWQFSSHGGEPCSFSSFLRVSVATYVTAHGVCVITMEGSHPVWQHMWRSGH